MDKEKYRTGNVSSSPYPLLALLAFSLLPACGDGGGSGGGPAGGAADICVSTPAGQLLSGALPGSGGGGQYTLGATQPSKGGVVVDIAGNYRYTPRTDLPSADGRARGMDRFSYRLERNGQTSEATVTVLIDGGVRIMPLGDSITAGTATGVSPDRQIGYRRKLYNDLDGLDSRYGIDFVGTVNTQGAAADPPLADRDHEGRPGWCDDNNPHCSASGGRTIDADITGILNANPPDLVLLHIGTNNFSLDNGGVASILDKISAWAQANYPLTVFLARIIPSVDGTLAVTAFNDNVEMIAHARPDIRVVIVDQQSALRTGGDANKADPALMADNLHPNATGYDRMANRWRDAVVGSGAMPVCQ